MEKTSTNKNKKKTLKEEKKANSNKEKEIPKQNKKEKEKIKEKENDDIKQPETPKKRKYKANSNPSKKTKKRVFQTHEKKLLNRIRNNYLQYCAYKVRKIRIKIENKLNEIIMLVEQMNEMGEVIALWPFEPLRNTLSPSFQDESNNEDNIEGANNVNESTNFA